MAQVQKIDISSSTIFRTILILLAFWFLYVVRDVLVVLIGAIVVAAAIEPVANRLQRYRVPRVLSVLLVYVAVLAIFAGAVVLLLPILAEQVTQLAQAVPHGISVVQGWLGHTTFIPAANVADQIQATLARLGNSLANIGLNVFQQTGTVFSGIISFFFVFIIALYLVLEKNGLMKFFHLIVPREHHDYVSHVVEGAQYKIGRWVLGQVTLGLIIGVTVAVGLWLLGVRYALALGLVAGIFEIVPVIGPILSAIPALLVGFTQSFIIGMVVVVFYIAVQQVENHVLIPNIMRRVTGLNPLATLIAVLLGARLAGVAGVILAVPVATILSVILADIFSPEEELKSGS